MIRPADLKDDDVWAMLRASRDGDFAQVKALASRRPALIRCEYNYTPPIHFAVREGHTEIVRYLLEQGADASSYRTYPFQDSLLTMAQDREHQPQVDRDGGLAGEQRLHAPLDREVAAVDLVVEADHLVGEFVVAARERVERRAQRSQDEVALRLERGLELLELVLDGDSHPKRPVT